MYSVASPTVIRGDRCDRFFMEEAGSYSNLIEAYGTAEALVEVLGDRIGTRFVWGTGGDKGAKVKGLREMMSDPESFNVLPHKHNYSRKGEVVYTSFFAPAHRMVARYADSRGYTDEVKAKQYFVDKANAKKNPSAKRHQEAEYCIVWEDMFLQEGSERFDRELIADQLSTIELGVLGDGEKTPKIESGTLDWVRDSSNKIIDVVWHPSPTGKVFIVEDCHPDRDKTVLYNNKYIAGIDSIDVGSENSVIGDKGSQFCIVVKERVNGIDRGDQYVCFYKERPADERDAYNMSLKILMYFQCKANLEDTKRSLVHYYRTSKQIGRLITRPEKALSNEVSSGKKKSRLIGTPGSEKIALYGDTLIDEYIRDNYYKIWFKEFLEEMKDYDYSKKRLFDIIAAMRMCEIYDEEVRELPVRSTKKVNNDWQDIGWYTDSNGVKRFGTIPDKNEGKLRFPSSLPTGVRFIDTELNEIIYDNGDRQ